jgi:ribosomal RNA-processing protein 12
LKNKIFRECLHLLRAYWANVIGNVEYLTGSPFILRIKSKYLFERLSRKFGHDLVSSLVPKTDEKTHKRLKNIRKELARRARHAAEDGGSGQDDDNDDSAVIRCRQKTMEELLADSSDDDEFDDEDGKSKDKKGKKKGGAAAGSAWIHEGGEGIVDLLSKDAAQRIVSTRPRATGNANLTAMGPDVRKRKAASDFKVGADGRLIITEDGGRRGSDSEDDDDDGDDGPKGNSR